MVFHDENKMTVDVYFHDCFGVSDAGQTVVAYLKNFITHILMKAVVSIPYPRILENKSKMRDQNARFPEKISRAKHCINFYMLLCFGYFPGNRTR